MIKTINADASPEKRLFISLITRDISLVAAFLDLIDNSINAVVEPHSRRLETAEDYASILQDDTVDQKANIALSISDDKVVIQDRAPGISSKSAAEHVFKFGRSDEDEHDSDRLSVYGIGLKRALFKLGKKIIISSDHQQGGFDLNLDVEAWARERSNDWSIPITTREPAEPSSCGTTITITELHEGVSRRLRDGIFIGQLSDAISKTYSFYVTKFVNIYLNDILIAPTLIEIGGNYSSDTFDVDGVSCAITAGIGIPDSTGFRDKTSGWFVFCNGRTLISADKTPLTGWSGSGLPIFQPKHRPFIGTVFFVSKHADKLPWNTMKSGINEDSPIWLMAKSHMISVGRSVISFLDGRYTDEGTDVSSSDLKEATGAKITLVTSAMAPAKKFSAPTRPKPTTTRIQYDANVEDVKKIANHLKKPGMSGSDVGRFTFHFFIRNEVRDE